MNAFRKKKEELVQEIKDLINSSSSLVIAEYRGLTVAEVETLRNELKEAGVFVKVYKNRLFKIASKEAGFGDLEQSLVGPNFFAFGSTDAIAPAKIISKFAKTNPVVVLKGGIFEGKVADAQEMQTVATLPNYEEALTMLASSLLGGLRQLSVGLKMLVDENKINA
ncbi:50S ribosomal protein L10 [Mesomycoplasma hyorhinis]|uniref:Large ribosomal subunit protein uL10 n=1 Tax=Mesomycoplasma hyorhinis TaxID=2100 RepID=A0ABD6IDM6_MESHY|nr:50S ribosomal protein L10 [Mesomycoplasma hyorhinis]MXR06501.1 50S ribosomal protein L10 [Mesomycoplasma hyorhinis]MXR07103.1 50S ribosomal protein L10 [Mesomycoplasma hyorhinis]MXR08478.1 50S ribosomal protein L10 [Mesomycoplasma hyorhinis]MXR43639.1 50S ribosomal protein L10 [Mesomycoplasma hyorhinis]MXR58008.1 50S ribosomal protein L10 [Mesomycoplasma hyorhinis]